VSPRAWVLNFDAELELEHGPSYTPSASMIARVRSLGEHFPLPDGDRTIDRASTGDRAVAWCPTPRALRAIVHAGLTPPRAPSFEVLRTVNERGFALALDDMEGAIRATSIEEVEAHTARGEWLLKRAFGVAGRGQRPVRAPLREDDRRWISASLARAALYVEPRVAITRELSVHGWVTDRVIVRSVRVQRVVDRAWVGSELCTDGAIVRELAAAGERAGASLLAAGYFGPFGVDAFEHRSLRAISEINARYCMGWDDADGWDPPL
jgi:hypothetical protein